MAETKNFDVAVAEEKQESLEFILGGVTFECQLPMPAIPMLELAANAEKGGSDAITAFYSFLKAIVRPDQLKKFEQTITKTRISLNMLMEICQWIMEESTARPNSKPSDSAPSLSEVTESSREDSSPPEEMAS